MRTAVRSALPFGVVAVLALAGAAAAQERPPNLVLFVADGFGPAHAELARGVAGAPLALDAVLVGSAQTAATDARVTDSAAGATAYACGLKTYNGAIAVDAGGRPCRTLLEAAEARGMATGLVTTTRLTHATPASFAAHVPDREMEHEIAAQLIDAGADVLVGGGAFMFRPREPDGTRVDGSRTDGRDLLREAAEAGYAVATDRAGWEALETTPVLALLAPGHLAYEIDRDETDQPALADLTRRALDLLAASPDGRARGFFLMVEAGRIDHAAHSNDPAAAARDVLAYDAAVRAALDRARADGRTLVVGVADHETGGLTLGCCGVYDWDPAALAAATMSFERLAVLDRARADSLLAAGAPPSAYADREPTHRLVRRALGTDTLAADEAARLAGGLLSERYREVLSARAGVGWTTGGHTAVDVNVYAFGPGAEAFVGSRPNDAVGRLLFEALGLPVDGESVDSESVDGEDSGR